MSAIDPQNPHTWPIDPASSKGERIPDHPTPSERVDEAKRMLDGLPKPPPPYADDDEIDIWLRNVAAVSADHLRWVYTPEVFNRFFDPVKRGRQQHRVGQLLRAIDDAEKARRQAEAEERAAKQKDELGNMLRSWRSE